MRVRIPTHALFAAAIVAVTATPADAQTDVRWSPFIGCWEALTEAPDAGLLCFRPADGGVEMTSVSDGEVVASEYLAADGTARPVVADGCEGTEAVTFSADGRRAFTRSNIVCGGESRSGSGVMAFLAPTRWVDVRALEVGGEKVSWVQEYMLAPAARLEEEGVDDPSMGAGVVAVTAARAAASQDVDLDDVREAARGLDTETVVAWVAAQGSTFDLDAAELVALEEEGMPTEIIDVVVAVSYPDRFVVAPEADISRVARTQEPDRYRTRRRVPVTFGFRSYLGWSPYAYDPYFYSPFGSRWGYSPFGYGGYGYGGYGYGYGGYYGGFGYGPTVIRVERSGSGGRVVNGRGWRSGSSTSTGRMARPAGGSSGSGSMSRPRSAGGGSGSMSRPSSSSGGGAVRTAKPRGGDGGSASSGRRQARPRGGR